VAPRTHRFPPPWKAVRTPSGFKIKDANGLALAYVHARGEQGGVNNDGLTVDEARRIAVGIARLPGLMGRRRAARLTAGFRRGLKSLLEIKAPLVWYSTVMRGKYVPGRSRRSIRRPGGAVGYWRFQVLARRLAITPVEDFGNTQNPLS
jgi:hypothetical protein